MSGLALAGQEPAPRAADLVEGAVRTLGDDAFAPEVLGGAVCATGAGIVLLVAPGTSGVALAAGLGVGGAGWMALLVARTVRLLREEPRAQLYWRLRRGLRGQAPRAGSFAERYGRHVERIAPQVRARFTAFELAALAHVAGEPLGWPSQWAGGWLAGAWVARVALRGDPAGVDAADVGRRLDALTALEEVALIESIAQPPRLAAAAAAARY